MSRSGRIGLGSCCHCANLGSTLTVELTVGLRPLVAAGALIVRPVKPPPNSNVLPAALDTGHGRNGFGVIRVRREFPGSAMWAPTAMSIGRCLIRRCIRISAVA